MKHLLDQYGDVISTFEYDELTDNVTIGHQQDCQAIIDNNIRLQTSNDGYSPSRKLRRVASIPNGKLMEWCRDRGISLLDFMRNPRAYQKELRRFLYDSDNRHLLTADHRR